MTTIRQKLHWFRNLSRFKKGLLGAVMFIPLTGLFVIFDFEIDKPPEKLAPARFQELYQQATAGNVDAQYALADAYWIPYHERKRGFHSRVAYDFDYFDNILAIAWHRIAARNCHSPSQEFLSSTTYHLDTQFGTGFWSRGAVDDIQEKFPKTVFDNCTE